VYMLRNVLLTALRVILSIITAFAIDYAFAEATAESLQQIPRPFAWVILILLAGGSGYGMYKFLGLFDDRVRDDRW